jgi:ferredoxin
MDEKEGKAKLVGAVKKGKLFVAEFFGCNEVFECDYELNQAAADACPMHIIKVQRNG